MSISRCRCFSGCVLYSGKEDNARVSFSTRTRYKFVYIYEVDKSTVGIKADAEGDGKYEKLIAESSGDETISGDANCDGAVNSEDLMLFVMIMCG